jgi:hypothetical protein
MLDILEVDGRKRHYLQICLWNGDGVPVGHWVRAWQQTEELINWQKYSHFEQIRCFKSKLQGKAWEWTIDQEPSYTPMRNVEHWEPHRSRLSPIHCGVRVSHERIYREDLVGAFMAGKGEEMTREIRLNV